MFGLGIGEFALIGIALLIIYYLGKKAPSIARNAGKSVAEFKQGLKDLPDEIENIKKEIKQ